MAEDTAESSANIDSTTPDWNASATVFAPIPFLDQFGYRFRAAIPHRHVAACAQ